VLSSFLLVCSILFSNGTAFGVAEDVKESSQQSQGTAEKTADVPLVINGAAGGRAMVPKDLLSFSNYEATAVSRDGKMVAVVVSRWSPGEGVPSSNHHNELWVIQTETGTRKKISTPSAATLTQSDPVWSPDGEQLAFLSHESGGVVILDVWDRRTGVSHKVSTRNVDMHAQINRVRIASGDDGGPFAWLDPRHLITILLPERRELSSLESSSGFLEIEAAGVKAEDEGTRPTALTVSSPPSSEPADRFLVASLVIFDTKNNSARVIDSLSAWLAHGAARDIVVSPDGRSAAVVNTEPPSGMAFSDGPISWSDIQRNRLGVVRLEKDNRIHWIDSFHPGVRGIPGFLTLTWRPDSFAFAIWGDNGVNRAALSVAVVEIPSGQLYTIAQIDPTCFSGEKPPRDPSRIAWLPDNQVAVRVATPSPKGPGMESTWWSVADNHATQLVSNDLRLKDETPSTGDEAVSLQTSATGRLFYKDGSGNERTLFPDLNPQLAEIEEPRTIRFEYRSVDGANQFGELLLPYGYVAGTRYPTVVSVYAGRVNSDNGTPASREDDSFLNLLLLAGHGYAVLVPSMPMPLEGIPGDPMLHLNDGVDPAIDKAIALGIVDPARLAVMGHSYGGYSTYGLLAQTNRYRAGIGLMGLSDLASLFGVFEPSWRYTDPNMASSANAWDTESGQGGMGVPVYADPARYVRNSPAFAANRIMAPLLIIDGDLDGSSTFQNEEMFTALKRGGKRVEFVRYLGEGHYINSPANILDMWQRIFAWLDTYVKNAPTAGQ
jgi:dipeptidyl aminopeptidase/acylaminoacyl peptidase